MKRVRKINLLFFFATSIMVFVNLLLSCTEDTPDNSIENLNGQEQPVDNRVKWEPNYGLSCPQELWDWCITERHTNDFPASEEYDYSGFSHSITHLLIFDDWNYRYPEFRYINLLQKELLHIFSNDSSRYALSRLSNRLFAVSYIKDHLQDWNNKVFYTKLGNYDCTQFIAMGDKNNFNLTAFAFDPIPDDFWMYVHDTGQPDNTLVIWTETDSVSFESKYPSYFDLPIVNVNTYLPDELVITSPSWCSPVVIYTNRPISFHSTPVTYVHGVSIGVSENTSENERSGIVWLCAKDHPNHGVAINVTQAGKSGGDDGGGSTVTSQYADFTSARTSYSGGHSTYSSWETMASHLNRYGLLIYKKGDSYYWKDWDEKKHTCSPNRTYTDEIYTSDIQTGNASNNYQLKKAYIYVSFRFSPF